MYSSVYSKIHDFRPYDTITLEKVECCNHLLRNYSNKLREIAVMSCKISSGQEDNIDRGFYMKVRSCWSQDLEVLRGKWCPCSSSRKLMRTGKPRWNSPVQGRKPQKRHNQQASHIFWRTRPV